MNRNILRGTRPAMPENLSIENQVIVALRRISRAIDLRSRVLVQQHGLTAPQLAALQAVGELQPVSVSAVARSIHLSMATVTGIFNLINDRSPGNRLVIFDGEDIEATAVIG